LVGSNEAGRVAQRGRLSIWGLAGPAARRRSAAAKESARRG